MLFFNYTKNARQLKSLSTTRISHTSYTVCRTYQIRENILLMKVRSLMFVFVKILVFLSISFMLSFHLQLLHLRASFVSHSMSKREKGWCERYILSTFDLTRTSDFTVYNKFQIVCCNQIMRISWQIRPKFLAAFSIYRLCHLGSLLCNVRINCESKAKNISRFRVCYLHREITKHPLILREFRNLGVIQILGKKVVCTFPFLPRHGMKFIHFHTGISGPNWRSVFGHAQNWNHLHPNILWSIQRSLAINKVFISAYFRLTNIWLQFLFRCNFALAFVVSFKVWE